MASTRLITMALAATTAAAGFFASAPTSHAAEGCAAIYSAGQTQVARCTYKATAAGAIIAGSSSWKVTVTKASGAKKVYSGSTPEYLPSSGAPIVAGDTVVAEVSGPGQVIVGTATEGNNVVLPKP